MISEIFAKMETLKFLFGLVVRSAFNQSKFIKRKYLNDKNFIEFVKTRFEFVSNFNNFPANKTEKPDFFKKEKTKDFIDFIENKENFVFSFENKKDSESIFIDFENDSLFADSENNQKINNCDLDLFKEIKRIKEDSEEKQKDIELL